MLEIFGETQRLLRYLKGKAAGAVELLVEGVPAVSAQSVAGVLAVEREWTLRIPDDAPCMAGPEREGPVVHEVVGRCGMLAYAAQQFAGYGHRVADDGVAQQQPVGSQIARDLVGVACIKTGLQRA